MVNFFGGGKKLTEKLYEQNLELAVKNKTFALLEELYQTSVLTLTPEQMAGEITKTIRKDLNLEFAEVLVFKKADDTLSPLGISTSERLTKILDTMGVSLQTLTVAGVSKHIFFKQAIYEKAQNITDNFEEVFAGALPVESATKIKEESHLKTTLLYPLFIGQEVSSVLLLALNRDYDTLNTFEQASIKSFINVIALLLDKANLYKNLQEANVELQKMDKIKNDFLAQTQHDLRTPLGIIRDYCDLLSDGTFGKMPKKALDVLTRIQVVAENKIKDVNNFLDTAQFQLGKKVVALKTGIELSAILDEIMVGLEPTAKAKNIYLKLEKPKEKITISADREKIKAALFNIIDNSVKYTLEGGVSIKVTDGDMVKITVSDTGIGIPKERIATLFETAFQRSEDAKKASPTGRGIGLYLSSQIIKAHNGKVWVESEGQGKGSVFHVELPANEAVETKSVKDEVADVKAIDVKK